MVKISPIANYLINNKVKPIKQNGITHFVTEEGAILGRMRISGAGSYKIFLLEAFGEGLKTLFSKSVAIGQAYTYIKNPRSPIGLSLVPTRTIKREIFVDFLEGKSQTIDSETNLKNELNLISEDEATGIGIFDTNGLFEYETKELTNKTVDLRKPKYSFLKH